jgi:hypothetical protein
LETKPVVIDIAASACGAEPHGIPPVQSLQRTRFPAARRVDGVRVSWNPAV